MCLSLQSKTKTGMEDSSGNIADKKGANWRGLLALSPLVVFLVVYLVSSIVAKDFYSVPVTSAFLIASCYAVIVTKGCDIGRKIEIFSKGASERNILLMLWIFILAGAFASTAKDIGAIEATVNLTLRILPGRLLFTGLFLAACFISLSTGTAIGTVIALVPITAGLATQTGLSAGLLAGIIVGGAFFGDNLSFISDTTIVSTKTQDCSMRDKFKVNAWIAIPAAVIIAVVYAFIGKGAGDIVQTTPIEWVKILPYILIIVLACSGVNVTIALAGGIVLNAIVGFSYGSLSWAGWLHSVGAGIGNMGELIIVTLLAGGMLELIRYNGGIDYIINLLTKNIKGKVGAELSIAILVVLASFCTANNTIAIVTTGGIAKDISQKYGVDPRKSASILDTFSCVVQGILPYGAHLLMAAAFCSVSTIDIIRHCYHPLVLFIFALLSILLRFPRKYS